MPPIYLLILTTILVDVCYCAVIYVQPSSQGIQQAIFSAAPGDTIQIAQGYYTGIQNCDLIISSTILTLISQQQQSSSSPTVIDCQGTRSRCITISNSSVTISGIKFINGVAASTSRTGVNTLQRHIGILPRRRKPPKTKYSVVGLIKLVVSSNGDFLSVPLLPRTTKRNKQRTFKSNSNIKPHALSVAALANTQDGIGGCMLITNGSSVAMSNVVLTGCQASNAGGGLAAISSQLSLNSVEVSKNIATGGGLAVIAGGGMFIRDCWNVSIANTNVLQNQVYSSGGNSLYGAGICMKNCDSVEFSGESNSVSDNLSFGSIDSSAFLFFGAGMYAESVNRFVFRGRNIIFSRNVLNNTGLYGALAGAGMILFQSRNISFLASNFLVSYNVIYNQGRGGSFGSGIDVFNCAFVSFVGDNTVVSNNIMTGYGMGAMEGGGLCFSSVKNLVFSGKNMVVSNNRLKGIFESILTTEAFFSPTTSNRIHCTTGAVIGQTSGTLNSGNSGLTTPNIDCSWLLNQDLLNRAFGQYVVQFTKLDLSEDAGCAFDSISLFDGTSSRSPLIGMFCGTFNNPICSRGLCPDLKRIVTTGAELTIAFHSNYGNRQGFAFNWTMQLANSTRSGSDGIMFTLTEAGAFGLGGGIAILSSQCDIDGLTISNNSVEHPLMGLGSGIAVANYASVNIRNSIFDSNVATGELVGGGGIGIVEKGYVSLVNNQFRMNRAVATGICVLSYDGMIRCALSMGGALLSMNSIIDVLGGSFEQNQVACENSVACNVQGGAIGLTRYGNLNMRQHSICTGNIADCTGDSCIWASGGCLYGDYNSIAIITDAILTNNMVVANGGGGALFVCQNFVLIASNLLIQNCSARQGGAMFTMDYSNITMRNTKMIQNVGTFAAGALLISGSTTILLEDSVLIDNTALRSSAILASSDYLIGVYSLKRTNITGPTGNLALMMGYTDITDTYWECSHPGSVFAHDAARDYFDLSCNPCDKGSYSIDAASSPFPRPTPLPTCMLCAFGSTCDGATTTSNGIRALAGFWGTESANHTATFYLCPSGFCCPLQQKEGCKFGYCSGHRVGTLCGSCPDGWGLRLFTESCGKDENCQVASWLIFLIVAGALGLGIYFAATTKEKNTGIFSVLLFYYQAVPLIKSTPWIYTPNSLVLGLQAVFNLSPSSGSDSSDGENEGAGMCLTLSMTQVQKIGFKVYFQGIIILALVIIFGIHWVLHRHRFSIPWFKDNPPVASRYVASACRVVTIAYMALILTPMQMLQCVEVEGKNVWWWDGNVECFAVWQIGCIIIVCFLVPLPLVSIELMRRWRKKSSKEWKNAIRHVLSNGFRSECRWWLGISLYRRLLLAFAFTLIADGNWRSIVISVLCFIFLGLQLAIHPFENKKTDAAETICLFTLCVLSVTTAPQLSHFSFGTIATMNGDTVLEWIQFALVLLPGVGFIAAALHKIGKTARLSILKGQRLRFVLDPAIDQEEEEETELEETQLDTASCVFCQQQENPRDQEGLWGDAWMPSNKCPVHQVC